MFDQCRSKMHCTGQHWTQIHKLKLYFRFCIQGSHHQHILGQTNLLLLFRKLLMHMGKPSQLSRCSVYLWLCTDDGILNIRCTNLFHYVSHYSKTICFYFKPKSHGLVMNRVRFCSSLEHVVWLVIFHTLLI